MQCPFEDIKSYLTNLLVLIGLILRKPLILYITTLDELVGALLAKNNKKGKKIQYII